MPARRFTDKEESDICKRYEQGESAETLGKILSASASTIRNILRRHKIRVRTSTEHKGIAISDACYDSVRDLYQDGKTLNEIAKEYRCSIPSVVRVLDKLGIERRTRVEAKGGISIKKYPEIIDLYQNGESCDKIAVKFNTWASTINQILKRNNIERRSISEAKGGLPKSFDQEVCKKYQEGETTYELGKIYGVDASTIGEILKRNNIPRRDSRILSDEFEKEICKEYLNGKGSITIAKELLFKHDISNAKSLVLSALERNNIQRRTLSEAQGGIPESEHGEICERYIKGETSIDLGSDYEVSHNTIIRILKRNNIERRQNIFGDSVQDVLDQTGRHILKKATAFYIYGIKGYPGFFKPGITNNINVRIDQGDGFYGDQYFWKEFETR